MLDVSVPCPSCPGTIRFGDRVCPSCRAPVPRALEAVLEDRLEASHDDFRALKGHIQNASVVLLVLAVVYAVFGLVAWFANAAVDLVPRSPQERAEAWISLLANMAIGAGLLGCFAWARRAPLRALTTAIALYLVVQTAVVVDSGLPWFYVFLSWFGWYGIMKLVTLFLLGRGLWSAWRAVRLRERLTRRDGPSARGVYR